MTNVVPDTEERPGDSSPSASGGYPPQHLRPPEIGAPEEMGFHQLALLRPPARKQEYYADEEDGQAFRVTTYPTFSFRIQKCPQLHEADVSQQLQLYTLLWPPATGLGFCEPDE